MIAEASWRRKESHDSSAVLASLAAMCVQIASHILHSSLLLYASGSLALAGSMTGQEALHWAVEDSLVPCICAPLLRQQLICGAHLDSMCDTSPRDRTTSAPVTPSPKNRYTGAMDVFSKRLSSRAPTLHIHMQPGSGLGLSCIRSLCGCVKEWNAVACVTRGSARV
jgi:hypothetical protein